eukprot:3040430-Rhodomonas_salina.2
MPDLDLHGIAVDVPLHGLGAEQPTRSATTNRNIPQQTRARNEQCQMHRPPLLLQFARSQALRLVATESADRAGKLPGLPLSPHLRRIFFSATILCQFQPLSLLPLSSPRIGTAIGHCAWHVMR